MPCIGLQSTRFELSESRQTFIMTGTTGYNNSWIAYHGIITRFVAGVCPEMVGLSKQTNLQQSSQPVQDGLRQLLGQNPATEKVVRWFASRHITTEIDKNLKQLRQAAIDIQEGELMQVVVIRVSHFFVRCTCWYLDLLTRPL